MKKGSDVSMGSNHCPTSLIEAPDKEALVNRNPHGDFKTIEAARPPYQSDKSWEYAKCSNPTWDFGDGASCSTPWKDRKMLSIDPIQDGRSSTLNYKLMISTTVPRPIALVSTISADGETCNLAPISYFQNVVSDPPIYMLSFPGKEANDTLRNILTTGQLCISMTSDWLVEAANSASVNTPPHISEWELTGLTPAKSEVVRCPYVAEAAFSVECTLYSSQEFFSKTNHYHHHHTEERSGIMVLIQAVRFHIWEDAVAEDKATADIRKLRPVFRAGGITYGSCFDGFEIPRPRPFRILRDDPKVKEIINGSISRPYYGRE